MTSAFRQILIAQCKLLIQDKMQDLQASFDQAENALHAETKSSAGDKYETSREMIQQDLDRLRRQLEEAGKDRLILTEIENLNSGSKQIKAGSLVETDQGIYFIAVGVGKVSIEGKTVFAVSLQSPIAQRLMGKQVGGVLEFNGKSQLIHQII